MEFKIISESEKNGHVIVGFNNKGGCNLELYNYLKGFDLEYSEIINTGYKKRHDVKGWLVMKISIVTMENAKELLKLLQIEK